MLLSPRAAVLGSPWMSEMGSPRALSSPRMAADAPRPQAPELTPATSSTPTFNVAGSNDIVEPCEGSQSNSSSCTPVPPTEPEEEYESGISSPGSRRVALKNVRTQSRRDSHKQNWNDHRRLLAAVFESKRFEMCMGLIIVFNIGCMVLEADTGARCRTESRMGIHDEYSEVDADNCIGSAFTIINVLLVLVYTVEAGVRLYTYRCAFWKSLSNVLEVIIVVAGLIDVILDFAASSNQQRLLLKLLRVMRLFRAVRLLTFFPELYRFVQLFAGALRPLFWGFILIIFMILFWSVISVEFINPNIDQVHFGDNDEDCQRNFSTVWHTTLFFFQTLVVGDDWGTCINPMVVKMPSSLIVFVFAVVTVQLGFMNLILSAIVDSASAAREHDHQQRAAEKQKTERVKLEKLRSIYEHLDHDRDGCISLGELVDGFESEPEVRNYLQGLNISTDDLKNIFDLMDLDRSGDLSYDEFVNTFVKAQSQDPRVHMMTVKLQGSQILREVREQAESMRNLAKQFVATGTGLASQTGIQEVKKLAKSDRREEHKREGFHEGDSSCVFLSPRSSSVPLSSPRSALKDCQAAPPKAGAPPCIQAALSATLAPEPTSEKSAPSTLARIASREKPTEGTGVATKVPTTSIACQTTGPFNSTGRCEAAAATVPPLQTLAGWRSTLTPRAVSRLPRLLREEEREPELQCKLRPEKGHAQSKTKFGSYGSHLFEKFTEDKSDRGVGAAAKGSIEGRFESAMPVWTGADQRSTSLQTGETAILEEQLRHVTSSLTEGLADITLVLARHTEILETSLDTRRTDASTACPSDYRRVLF